MSDATLIRALAGPQFRRADTLRDERGVARTHKVEEFLVGLPGWLPPGRERARAIAGLAEQVAAVAQTLREADDAAVVQRFRAEFERAKQHQLSLGDAQLLAPVFACIGEASRRKLGMWPHPVQFAGARVLLTGRLAEMQTGEGKTLVAGLAATALAGSGAMVHVISTNDYLAQRDCEEMTPLFEFFGLSGGHVIGGMEADERRTAYRNSICYVSGKEVVFDYLKDRLAGHGAVSARVSQLRRMWQPEASGDAQPLIPALHAAIVDEADSVLIDEARTPMIISRETPGLYETELLQWAIGAARTLKAGVHYKLREAREIELLPAAVEQAGLPPEGVRPVWRSATWREMLLRQALTALHLYTRDQHYILAEGKVQIVDESTGRVMADRSWEQGLHQLIEIKEGLEATQGRETMARMTFQRFFRRYYLLAGLTGTGAEASRELWSVYRLKVRRIPPNRANQRRRLTDECTATPAQKWQRVADDAVVAAVRGQAVLIGTRSVEASEQIGAELTLRHVEHVVLNARQDTEEASIVAQAGQPGRITVATNMAGRGTDIKLKPEALAAGGLHVILTEFHESPRVDRQLIGRSGRQGNVGSARAIVSAQDGLFEQQPKALLALLAASRGAAQRRLLRWIVRACQSRAERRAYQARMQTLKQDRELHRLIGFAGKLT
jgi:preprotein translocase subunit SecA